VAKKTKAEATQWRRKKRINSKKADLNKRKKTRMRVQPKR